MTNERRSIDTWSMVNFGKYKGKTLPRILCSDPDWFFWAHGEDAFRRSIMLEHEADKLAERAQAIRLPPAYRRDHVVSYNIGPDGTVWDFSLVPESRPIHRGGSTETRTKHLDLSMPKKFKSYDKTGNKKMLSSFRSYWFDGKQFRKDRVEEFFADPANFA